MGGFPPTEMKSLVRVIMLWPLPTGRILSADQMKDTNSLIKVLLIIKNRALWGLEEKPPGIYKKGWLAQGQRCARTPAQLHVSCHPVEPMASPRITQALEPWEVGSSASWHPRPTKAPSMQRAAMPRKPFENPFFKKFAV